ncbi:MAG: aldehyde dehydrogenase family protein [Sphingomonadaceae bacterium]|jgi:acyl-CoA reductase-like NAD-dependent aldehyde dehydrogenase
MSIIEHANWEGRAKALPLRISPFVEGEYVENTSSATFMKYNPANGALLHHLPEGTQEDVDRAVASARRAFEDRRWRGLPLAQRKTILLAFADLVETNLEDLALLDALEVGKPIRDALNVDLPLSIGVLRYCAEGIDKIYGETSFADDSTLSVVARSPRGVVAGSIGWNFPTVLAAQKIGPALATGNSLVLKPSELSSLSALRLAELAIEAGVPAGVFNVVPGIGATVGNGLAMHNDIDMITFTGSSATGKRIMQAAGASNMKRLLLECGGKSANVVFPDFEDLDAVAQGVIGKMFWNQGQVCVAGTRLIVHKSIKDSLVSQIVKGLEALRPGHPLEPETTFGPLVSAPQMSKVLGYIEQGSAQGAGLVCGGGRILADTGGYFVEPTIFDQVLPDMTIAQEEIFGPVLSVMTFDDVKEAMRLANATKYGLSASVWTTDISRMQEAMRSLRVGELAINACPQPSAGAAFGSLPLEGHKQSGFGVESGAQGLLSYTCLTSVQIHGRRL